MAKEAATQAAKSAGWHDRIRYVSQWYLVFLVIVWAILVVLCEWFLPFVKVVLPLREKGGVMTLPLAALILMLVGEWAEYETSRVVRILVRSMEVLILVIACLSGTLFLDWRHMDLAESISVGMWISALGLRLTLLFLRLCRRPADLAEWSFLGISKTVVDSILALVVLCSLFLFWLYYGVKILFFDGAKSDLTFVAFILTGMLLLIVLERCDGKLLRSVVPVWLMLDAAVIYWFGDPVLGHRIKLILSTMMTIVGLLAFLGNVLVPNPSHAKEREHAE